MSELEIHMVAYVRGLEAEVEQLREAMEPFATIGRALNRASPDMPDVQVLEFGLTAGHFRRAAALKQ